MKRCNCSNYVLDSEVMNDKPFDAVEVAGIRHAVISCTPLNLPSAMLPEEFQERMLNAVETGNRIMAMFDQREKELDEKAAAEDAAEKARAEVTAKDRELFLQRQDRMLVAAEGQTEQLKRIAEVLEQVRLDRLTYI